MCVNRGRQRRRALPVDGGGAELRYAPARRSFSQSSILLRALSKCRVGTGQALKSTNASCHVDLTRPVTPVTRRVANKRPQRVHVVASERCVPCWSGTYTFAHRLAFGVVIHDVLSSNPGCRAQNGRVNTANAYNATASQCWLEIARCVSHLVAPNRRLNLLL